MPHQPAETSQCTCAIQSGPEQWKGSEVVVMSVLPYANNAASTQLKIDLRIFPLSSPDSCEESEFSMNMNPYHCTAIVNRNDHDKIAQITGGNSQSSRVLIS